MSIIYSAALTYNTHHQELRALQFSVFPWLHEAFGPWSSLCEVLLAVYSGYGVYLAVHQGACDTNKAGWQALLGNAVNKETLTPRAMG